MIIKITKLTFCIKGATKSPQREEGYSLGTIDFALSLRNSDSSKTATD